jgi:hypothetical protein
MGRENNAQNAPTEPTLELLAGWESGARGLESHEPRRTRVVLELLLIAPTRFAAGV